MAKNTHARSTTDPALAATRAAPVQIGADADSAADPAFRLQCTLDRLWLDLSELGKCVRELEAYRREGTTPTNSLMVAEDGESEFEVVRRMIDDALEVAYDAFEALADGGANTIESPTDRGARARNIYVHLDQAGDTITEAAGVFFSGAEIRSGLADRLEALARWARADHVALSHRRSVGAAPTDGDYRPASWFGPNLYGRLRKAAARGRKTKRVRWIERDKVKLYHVEDARRWWPDDVPGGKV